MRIPRILIREQLIEGTSLELPKSMAVYLVQVLRLGEDAPLVLMDGVYQLARARILTANKRGVTVVIDELFTETRESSLQITLWQCLSKGERMDYTLQKAMELGVTHIVPVMSERVNLRLDDERLAKRYDHWQGVMDSAAMQSCRTQAPKLGTMLTLTQVCEQLAKQDSLRLVLDPKATATCQTLIPQTHIDLLIGCEGGLTERELAQLKQAGFIGVRLGPRVLRTETAGLAILSLLQGLWGDM